MIFVTVGTHEQPFDRLIREIDQLKENNILTEEVIVQTGYSNYIPKYCKHKKMMGLQEMEDNIQNARIVITHGGTGSIFGVIEQGKVPIVVPRQPNFGEHVDMHQVEFAKFMENQKLILAVYEITTLKDQIENYQLYSEKAEKRAQPELRVQSFVRKLEVIVDNLVPEKNKAVLMERAK